MKKIVLGITASISAYKSCELVRRFVNEGYSVFPVLTKNAAHLVTPLTLETLSGSPVYTGTFNNDNGEMPHIDLKENASLFLVAPATANCIGKFAHGIADDLLSTTFLTMTCPIVIAPAMNPAMYAHRAVQENIVRLKSWGITIVEPESGAAVCGDTGKGKLADITTIYQAALDAII